MINIICDECNQYIKTFNEIYNPEGFMHFYHKFKDCATPSMDKSGNKESCVHAYATDLLHFARKGIILNQTEVEK